MICRAVVERYYLAHMKLAWVLLSVRVSGLRKVANNGSFLTSDL